MNLRLQYHPRDGKNLKAQTGKHSSHRAGVDSLLIQRYTFWFSVIYFLIQLYILFDSALYFLIQRYTFWFSVVLFYSVLYTFNSFTVPPTPNTNLHKTDAPALNPHVMPCFEGLDTSQCPNCTGGLYCDGLHCVKKADCTCQYKNKIIMVRNLSLSLHLSLSLLFTLSLHIYFSSGLSITLSLRVLPFFLQKTDIVTTDTCETCQCYSGELRCVPKSCPACASVSTCIT